MARARVAGAMAVAAAWAAACGSGSGSPPPARYALEAVGGTYDEGSGLRGVAILATLRDAAGAGPGATWAGTLDDGTGTRARVTYADPATGSSAASWWPDLPFASGTYTLTLASGGVSASASLPPELAQTPPQTVH